jgi:hypothetical protein
MVGVQAAKFPARAGIVADHGVVFDLQIPGSVTSALDSGWGRGGVDPGLFQLTFHNLDTSLGCI